MKQYNLFLIITWFFISIFSNVAAAQETGKPSVTQLNADLFNAIEAEDLVLVEKIISHGASIDAKNQAGETLLEKLFLLVNKKNKKKLSSIANYLIKQGHDISHLSVFNTSYLHDAVENNMLETATLLISEGIDTSVISNTTRNNALFYAQSKEMIKLLIAKQLGSFKSISSSGDTLLHNASNANYNIGYLRYLIKHIPIETKNAKGDTPLLQTLTAYHEPEEAEALVSFFLANRADVNATDNKQRNALQVALRNENLLSSTIKQLIKAGANLSHQDQDGTQAIHFAAAQHFEYLKLLYSYGMDLNATTGSNNDTPLIIATKNNNEDTVKYLLKHKVKLNTLDKKGKTALNYARENDFSDIVMMLEEKKAKASSDNEIKQTALSAQLRANKILAKKPTQIKTLNDAIKYKNLAAVKKHYSSRLLDKSKPAINIIDIAKYTLQHGDMATLNYLISKGLDIHKKNNMGYSLLHYAVFYNNINASKFLIAKKLDINAITNDNKSVFDLSANSSVAMVNILLKSNITISEKEKSNIIKEAITNAAPEVAEYFIKKGFPFSINDYKNSQLLINLISNEEIDTLNLLIKKGLNINTQINYKENTRSLLHLAIILNKQKSSQFLITAGADVNTRSEDKKAIFEDVVSMGDINILKSVYDHGGLLNDVSGTYARTPILVALESHKIDSIKFLINRGADLNIVEGQTKNTPLHVAAEKGYLDIIKRMIKKGAKPGALNSNNETPLDLAVKFKQEAIQQYLSAL